MAECGLRRIAALTGLRRIAECTLDNLQCKDASPFLVDRLLVVITSSPMSEPWPSNDHHSTPLWSSGDLQAATGSSEEH
eukprot:15471405-Alexandrium_andersonii.AAC.1